MEKGVGIKTVGVGGEGRGGLLGILHSNGEPYVLIHNFIQNTKPEHQQAQTSEIRNTIVKLSVTIEI